MKDLTRQGLVLRAKHAGFLRIQDGGDYTTSPASAGGKDLIHVVTKMRDV